MAIEVGKVFETERSVINYENLGIGRLDLSAAHHPVARCSRRRYSRRIPLIRWIRRPLFTINKFLRTT